MQKPKFKNKYEQHNVCNRTPWKRRSARLDPVPVTLKPTPDLHSIIRNAIAHCKTTICTKAQKERIDSLCKRHDEALLAINGACDPHGKYASVVAWLVGDMGAGTVKGKYASETEIHADIATLRRAGEEEEIKVGWETCKLVVEIYGQVIDCVRKYADARIAVVEDMQRASGVAS